MSRLQRRSENPTRPIHGYCSTEEVTKAQTAHLSQLLEARGKVVSWQLFQVRWLAVSESCALVSVGARVWEANPHSTRPYVCKLRVDGTKAVAKWRLVRVKARAASLEHLRTKGTKRRVVAVDFV